MRVRVRVRVGVGVRVGIGVRVGVGVRLGVRDEGEGSHLVLGSLGHVEHREGLAWLGLGSGVRG